MFRLFRRRAGLPREQKPTPPTVHDLIRAAEDDLGARRTLIHTGDLEAARVLLMHDRALDPIVAHWPLSRWDLVLAPLLVRLGPDQTRTFLLDALRHPDTADRAALVAWQIARSSDREYREDTRLPWQPLKTVVADEAVVAELGRLAARSALVVDALGYIGGSAAFTAVIQALSHFPEMGAKALSRLGDPAAVPALVQLLGHDQWHTAWSAAQALRVLKWRPRGDDERIRIAILEGNQATLRRFGARATAPLIDALRREGSPKAQIISMLGVVGDAASVPILLTYLTPSRQDYQRAEDVLADVAAEALARVLDRDAGGANGKDLEAAVSLTDIVVRYWPTRDGETYLGVGMLERTVSCARIRELAERELGKRNR